MMDVTSRRRAPWFFLIPCIATVVLGIVLGIDTLVTLRRAQTIERWPSVPARIQDCRLEEREGGEGTLWYVSVRYTYTVSGREHIGMQINPNYSSSDFNGRKVQEELHDALNSSVRVLAHYNPDAHSEAYIVLGRYGTRTLTFMCIGLLLVVFGISASLSEMTKRRLIAIVLTMGILAILAVVFSNLNPDYVAGLTVIEPSLPSPLPR